jgi:hypothetical protein
VPDRRNRAPRVFSLETRCTASHDRSPDEEDQR